MNTGFDQQYVDELKDRIVNRTRLGIGINPVTGKSERLERLSENYKEVRRGDARWVTLPNGKVVKIKSKDAPKKKPKKPEGLSEPDVPKTKRRKKSIGSRIIKIFSKKKPKTKKKKSKVRRLTNLASTTTPSKSNVTATGQMLKALTTVKIKTENGVKFSIRLGDNRGRNLDGKTSAIGNREVNEYLEKQGRKWLGFTKPQLNQISREIRQIIIKFLQ